MTVITAAVSEICFSLYAGPAAAGIFLAGICTLAAVSYCRWDRPVFFLSFTAFATLVYELTAWAGMIFFGASRSFLYLLRAVVLGALYNLAIMLLLWKGYITREKGREEL